jgi:hypothetical protein
VTVVVVIALPITLGLPAVFSSIPPLVVLAPATVALDIQIAPAVLGLPASRSVVLNGMIKSRFRLLDRALAMAPVIGMRAGRRRKG